MINCREDFPIRRLQGQSFDENRVNKIIAGGWIAPIVTAMHVALAAAASGHIILTKRDVRAAIGWIGLVWLSPLLGTTLYVLLGINHIRRKAKTSRQGHPRSSPAIEASNAADRAKLAVGPLAPLVTLMGWVTGRPLTLGNAITPLEDGDAAYPAMLRAIASAERSVGLSSYIFNYDSVGKRFVEALGEAARRGVRVRVLVDAIGSHYHFPSIVGPLKRAGVPVARFLPSILPIYFPYFNLRNHRKILLVDGRVGFTGGMNIDDHFDSKARSGGGRHDIHFCVEGPIVDTLREVFADDWAFRTGEILDGDAWAVDRREVGTVIARGVIDGPDSHADRLFYSYLGALDCARESVAIVTPYFLPDAPLVAALNSAAMRGVEVDIFLPESNNLALVQCASTAMLWQILQQKCRVWAVPGRFDHSKFLVVDRDYSLIGSGNWDQRSLRLNFEFNLECYDKSLASDLRARIDRRREVARPITLAEVDGRPWPIRLRDGTARLFSPYL